MWISISSVILWAGIFALVRSDTSAFSPLLPPLAPEASAPASAFASVAPGTNPIVEAIANDISYRLQHSRVLGPASTFVILNPHDEFLEVDTKLLARAGIYDPTLTELVADAVQKVAPLSSQLYFDTIGHVVGYLYYDKGILTPENTRLIAHSFENAVEVNACLDGVSDAKSVHVATTNGLFDKLEAGGWNTYKDWSYVFKVFAAEVQRLAGVQ